MIHHETLSNVECKQPKFQKNKAIIQITTEDNILPEKNKIEKNNCENSV